MKIQICEKNYLQGRVSISGSKNATLALLAICILTDEELILNNVPYISDVKKMCQILKDIGVEINYNQELKILKLKSGKVKSKLYQKEVHEIRASYYLMGALIARRYSIKTLYPGGCSFTKRPIDYHLNAFKEVGYKITEKKNLLIFKKGKESTDDKEFNLARKSVGATINIIYINVLRNGVTIINNASLEPEVLEVIRLLNKMGSKIEIINNSKIKIQGVKKLVGASHTIIPDRIEAGSYMLLASAVERSDIIIENINLTHLKEIIKTIKSMGVDIMEYGNKIRIKKENPIIGIEKVASYYPKFPTDLQQILSVVLTKATTKSIIYDLVYPKRTTHLTEIKKCGGIVKTIHDEIHIEPSILTGNILYAHDLRCGFSCLVLGVISRGKTIVENAEIIDRGYEKIIEKFNCLGIKTLLINE